MQFGFNALLENAGLRPAEVTLLFHTTNLPILRRMLSWVASERPELFEAYQSVHSITAERTLKNRPYVASFVPLASNEMAFVAVYRIVSFEDRPTAEIYSDPRFAELELTYGASDTAPAHNMARIPRQLQFTMQQCDALSDLRGRVVVLRPGGRAYARLAEGHDPPIRRVEERSVLTLPPPDWRDFSATGQEVRGLPGSWASRLREWRGIYDRPHALPAPHRPMRCRRSATSGTPPPRPPAPWQRRQAPTPGPTPPP